MKLAEIWAGILGRNLSQDRIGIDDNFFRLGGHSLKATSLVSLIHKTLNIKIPLGEIFKRPTIRGLFDYINDAVGEKYLSIEPVEKKEYYILSSAQKRLYFLQQMDSGGTAYNISAAWIVEGVIDKLLFEQALAKLIRRHESIRTSFVIIGEEPAQRVHDEAEFEIEYKDLATDGHGQTRTLTKVFGPTFFQKGGPPEAIIKSFIRTFDLSKAPLMRVGLLRIEESKHLLIVDIHHIIADGTSMAVIVKDFMFLYRGEGGDLAELRVQYKDFSGWQNSQKQGESIKRQENFWVNEFDGEMPVLELPTDFTRPSVQSFEGSSIPFEIDKETAEILKMLALETDVTMYMLLLALYTVFLSKLTNQEDIVVGSPIAGRRHADLETIVGIFVNTLAMRNYPSGEKKFSDFLEEVKGKTLKAFENQEYQYEDLVERATKARDVSRNPLFDTMFALQNTGSQEIEIPGLKLGPYEYESKTSKFDLSLTGVEVEDKLLFTFEYSTKLFKLETVERFSAYFVNIIHGVLEDRQKKISDFEIITEEERRRILFNFNNTEAEYPKDKTVPQLFAEQSLKIPDRISVIGGLTVETWRATPLQITYRQLNEQSDRLAGWLIEKGVLADNIVGIMMEPSIEIIIGIFGILKSGAAYLPIDPGYPRERIDYMLKDSDAKLLAVANDQEGEKVRRWEGEKVLLESIIYDSNHLKGCPRRGPHHSSFIIHHSNHLAYIVYTSGSTGRPKGVMIDHKSFIDFTTWAVDEFEHRVGYQVLLSNSFASDGSIQQIFPPLISGGVLHVITKELRLDVARYLDYLKVHQINNIDEVPVLMKELVALIDPADREEKLPDLTCLSLGSEYVPIELIKKCRRHLNHHGRIINAYGPAEASVETTTYHCDGTSDSEQSLIGKPRRNIRVYILDDAGHLCPTGIRGEICISGLGLARGYLNQPELTAERFKINRSYRSYEPYILYKTGDLARWLPDGNIEFIGRIDNQVKIRGFRVELAEIENRLLSVNGVKEAVVLECEEVPNDKYLCAYFVSSREYEVPELRDYLSKELPDYMIPSYFMRLEKIPLTTNGKIDRKALPKPKLKIGESYIAPRNEVEKKLVEIWSEILGRLQTPIGIDDNFFQLGGHSLKATIMMSRIHKDLNVKVELMEIFRTPTIRDIARLIRGLKKEAFQAIEPVEKKEYYPLSSAQKRLYFLQQLDLNSTGYNMPMVLPLGQGIKKDKLEFALRQLIARHESLRTSIERVNADVIQRIHENVEFEIEYYDLAAKNAKDREGKTKLPGINHQPASIIHHFIRPFDLSRVPLLRSGLIMLPDGNYVWLVDIHHIVSDGTSHTILTEDFMRLYETEVPLEPLPLQYKDFAQWQNQLFASGRLKDQEDYWLQLYTGEIPRLNLAADAKRPAVFTFKGDYYLFGLGREETAEIKALGARNGGTLYMNIMALLNTLFYKYTGQNDIIIGSGIAGRRHADIQGVVGMFVNTLAMRNYPTGEKSYENFLREVIANSVKGFENQDVQFEELVEKLDPERDPSRNPLFDIIMVVQNFSQVNEYGQWEIATENHPGSQYKNKTSKFDLTFFISESEDDIHINLEYYTAIFKEETIERLAGHFKNVLHAVIKNPSIALKDIAILSEKEKEQLLYEFNDTNAEFHRDKTIHRLIEEQVARTPHYAALVYKDHILSYQELDRQANRLARYLFEEKKIGIGGAVGVWMSQPVYRQVALLGILKAGGVFVPMDPAIPAERIKYIIDDARIGVMISEKHHLRDLNRLQWECADFHSYLCIDSVAVHAEEEQEINQLMDRELWQHVGESATDEITGGGWLSSYTGLPISREEMAEYGDNILKKLEPLLHPGMKVLEIGCASGISMYRIAPKVGLYYGTDLSEVIIEKNKKQVREKDFHNIRLACLPAHEIDRVPVKDFDLVIVNSVIQCFHGHNYLRKVLHKAVALLGNNGYLFIGDVMNQEKKDALVRDLTAFKEANRHMGYTTKTDFSAELFVSPGFWRDLEAGWDEIEMVTCSDKLFSIENELTKFRYDVLVKVSKAGKVYRQKLKYQDDMRSVSRHRDSCLGLEVLSGHLAYIIYTSGSTGKPKGVMVEHRSPVNLCCWHNTYYAVTSWDRATKYAGFGFDASVWEFFPYLVTGASICIVPEEIMLDMEALNGYYEKNGVTISFLPTQVCEQFLALDNRSLRILLTGGDKLRYYIKKNYRLYNNYGPTENTVVTTHYWVTEENANIPIGKPVFNNRIYIMDRNRHLQPIGVPGELYIGGESLARGYLNNPELTAEKFVISQSSLVIKEFKRDTSKKIPNDQCPMTNVRLYKTGDLTRWLPDGNIEFLGRIDLQVKIRGYRIELEEIEKRLLTHGNIKEAVVLAKEDIDGEKYLAAYFVSNGDLSGSELREHLLKDLPDYMIPSYFVRLEKIPLASNGKVDRRALPRPGLKAGESYNAPENEIEKKLVELWSEILGRDALHRSQLQLMIGIDDNFFELGGHSLKATILASKIHKAFHVSVPLAEIFKTPTIRGLANYFKAAVKDRYVSIEPVEKKAYYALSSAQKRLYILHQMDEQGVGYNIPAFSILEGEIDKDRLEQTLKLLISRHESLRTSFHIINDEPAQRIHDEVAFEIEQFDLAAKDAKDREDFHHSSFIGTPNHFIRAFDLSKAPLLRVGLLKENDYRHILMVDMHHIISDGTSMAIVVKDFMALYRGEGGDLSELRVQYKDFSEWQNSEKQKESIKRQDEFWLTEFAGEMPVLQLPTDYTRPSVQSFEGGSIPFEIDKEAAGVLKKLGLESDVTMYMILLAIYDVFLSKLTVQEDIIVGSPIAGRRHADLEKIIGMFVNTLALRNYPSGEKKFTDFLGEVKERTLNAFENQENRYEDLVDRVVMNRDVSRNPLFDTMFALQNTGSQEIEIPGLKLAPCAYENKTSKFDLVLTAVEVEDILQLTFEYCTKLFRADTIGRFITYFKKIVNSIIKDKDRKISDFEIITEEEKKRILFDFNNTEVEYPKDKTIHQLFEEQVEQVPDHISVVGASTVEALRATSLQITYGQLNKQSNRLAGLLIEKGVVPDTIVAIMTERSVEMVIGILGILKSGGAYLPIEPAYPQERINYMLKDSGGKILLTAADCVFNFHHSSFIIHHSSHSSHSSHLAYIIYTYGTTGKPKGVPVEHRNAVNTVKWFVAMHKVGSDTHLLQLSGYTFDASVNQIFGSLISGAGLYIATKVVRADMEKLRDYINYYRINVINFVPALLKELLCDVDKLKSLHTVISGAEKLEEATKEAIVGKGYRLVNQYGPTETTIDALALECSAKQVTLGKPIANVKIYIMDKYEKVLPIGVVGELYIAGAGIARGYLNRPELTAEKFVDFHHSSFIIHDSKIYRTGDLARWLPDGNVEFLGRIDRQVKIRGFRIELGEIENRLLKHEQIKDVVLLAKEDATGAKYLAAYFVSGREIPGLELREYLSKDLPEYMIPSYFVQMGKIPITPSGKVDRGALPVPGEIGLREDVGYTLPSSDVEKKLVEIWEKVLGRNNIGINENFFVMGGDSIKSIQIISRMSNAGYKMEMKDLFQYPLISDLASRVKKMERIPDQSVITGTIPLTPIQEKFFTRPLTYRHHYNQAVMLYFEEGLREETARVVFSKIQEHHDALRMSYIINEGHIKQTNHGLAYPLSLQVYDLRAHENAAAVIEENAGSIQANIDLGKGPMMKLGLFHCSDGDYLLIVIHHLVIDGISWRILFEDIDTLYQQYKKSAPLVLPPKTDPFKLWSEKQTEYAHSTLFLKEKGYWGALEQTPIPAMKTDFPGDNFSKDTGSLSFTLNEETTSMLLGKVNEALGTEINDTLLTALGLSINSIYGINQVPVALEGHGREKIVKDIDITRTVGWFTTVYPVILDMSYKHDLARQIKEVKEHLHQLPQRGIGYGILKYLTDQRYKEEIEFRLKPQICFNYLGQFDTDIKQDSFEIANQPLGNSQDPREQREYQLEISGMVSGHCLTMTVGYNKTQYKKETIEKISGQFKQELSRIISHCTAFEKKQLTPSDFAYKNLSFKELNEINKLFDKN
ncbi:MAG: amino acid adenylation domain-containing protein [Candidatus Aminicenantes bacterium]|nr:amino acid adenylation domain-containing protein [Candidatus Aminicenantes bacterium]